VPRIAMAHPGTNCGAEKRRDSTLRPAVLASVIFGLMAGGAFAQGVAPQAAASKNAAARADDAAYEEALRKADELIKDGEPGKAYALLEPLEFDHAGEERFDYLIGIAALDSGKPDKATFAFERVLAANPAAAAARLDMARAYFQLGDLARAKTEFLAVSRLDISATARANVEKYLDEIEARESGAHTRMSGYVEGTAGHDSNVNFSSSQAQIVVNAIPVGPVTLAPANLETPDAYRAVAAGGEVRHDLNENWQLDAGADWRRRVYNFESQFDAFGLEGRAGVAYEAKTERFHVGFAGGRNRLGGAYSYDDSGIAGEWRHTFSPANQASVFVQRTKYRYADLVMQPNDFDQQAFGVGWLHVTADGRATLSAGVYRGTEQDVSALITAATPSGGRADGPRRFSGFRIGAQAAAGEETTLFISGGVQAGNYERTNPLFLRLRNDRYSDVTAGANWSFAKRWMLRPQLNFAKNSSNIVIYSYIRRDVSLTIRRDFR